jgi:hypothetical protein
MIHFHEWKQIKEVRQYRDYDGNLIRVFDCECSICGKRKKRKFW